MLVMSVFSLITPSSDVLKPTKTPVERGEGLCVRGLNRGTVRQALVTHGKELTVLNTPGGGGLLALVLFVYQGGHPPDEYLCVVWDRVLCSTLGLFNF